MSKSRAAIAMDATRQHLIGWGSCSGHQSGADPTKGTLVTLV